MRAAQHAAVWRRIHAQPGPNVDNLNAPGPLAVSRRRRHTRRARRAPRRGARARDIRCLGRAASHVTDGPRPPPKMLEPVLAYYLNQYLGKYVTGLDAQSLRVSVWRGDVVLRDLKLRQEALEALKLPITVRHGVLGTLRLKARAALSPFARARAA